MIINYIPKSSKEATTKSEIYKRIISSEWDIDLTFPEMVRTIKALRLQWTPILWNSHWIFISYDKKEIIKHIKTIDNSIKWFNIWMTKIKKSLQKHDWTFKFDFFK